jgi:signal transduction histidine kinase
VQLQVADNGPGVPAADRGRITERFYRCERSRTTPGHGLGLSLVAAIADLHNASLSIEDAAPGLRFRITFPAAARPKPRPAVAQAAVGLEPR